MNDLQKHGPENDIRPEEYVYLLGWLVWCAAGGYFIYRGLVESHSLMLAGGSAAILMGVSFAAVIAVKPLRPWKKVVGWIWAVLVLLALIIVQVADVAVRLP